MINILCSGDSNTWGYNAANCDRFPLAVRWPGRLQALLGVGFRSRHGGMPLVLDDALGYSDSERLKGMGTVLSIAARECQAIILACMPDRYAYVGNAKVVELE